LYKRPPTHEVNAGYSLKYITVSLFSGENKPISKNNCGMNLKISFKNFGSNQETILKDYYAEKGYNGCYSFIINKILDNDFIEAGEYIFRFKSSLEEVKSKVYTLVVKPTSYTKLECTKKEIIFKIGSITQDINLVQKDEFNNIVFIDIDKNITNDVKITCENKEFKLNEDYILEIENNLIKISNLLILSGKIMDDKYEKSKISITFNMKTCDIGCNIFPGNLHTIDLSLDSKSKISEKYPVNESLPALTILLYDKFNNRIYEYGEDLICYAKSEYFKKEYKSNIIENSEFRFKSMKLKSNISEETTINIEFSIPDKNIKFMQSLIIFPSTETTIPPIIKINSSDEKELELIKSNKKNETEIVGVVGTEIAHWRMEFYDGKQYFN
jgi:hypothetical protein